MKFFIVLALAVVASAEYAGEQHIPVIGANGVPVDTAAVQHTKAAHFASVTEAQARNGDYYYPYYSAYTYGYPTYPAVTPVGLPVDTAEVAAAKANHFAAHAEALARNGHFRYRRDVSGQHLPVIGANGVPVDTAEVQQAKVAHFAAKAEAYARNGDVAVSPYYAPYAYSHTPYSYTPYSYTPYFYSTPYAYSAYSHYGYATPYYYGGQHVPVIENGVPVEPVEVQQARSAHLAAHAEAAKISE